MFFLFMFNGIIVETNIAANDINKYVIKEVLILIFAFVSITGIKNSANIVKLGIIYDGPLLGVMNVTNKAHQEEIKAAINASLKLLFLDKIAKIAEIAIITYKNGKDM